jgi:hypothetical protein
LMQDYERVQDSLRILAIDGIEGGAGRLSDRGSPA